MIWTDHGLESLTDDVAELGEYTGTEEARTLDEFTQWVHHQRFAALDAYYASDHTDMEAFGEAIAMLNINHKLHDLDIEVNGRTTQPTEHEANTGDA